jgi:prolipoprotein diacylglyceryltransferase
MHPILTVLEWHGVTRPIGSYGAMLVIALLVGTSVCVYTTRRAGLDVGAMISSLAGAVGAGFAAAYLTTFLVWYAKSGSLEVSLAHPGITFYGGVIGGALGLAGCARVFGLPMATALDLALPGLPLAHAIGSAVFSEAAATERRARPLGP